MPAKIGTVPVEPGHRYDYDRLGDVVEDDHLVVEGEGQVGHVAVVGRGVGQMLDVANGVVAGVSDRSATERGQLGQMHRADRLDPAAEFLQRVFALELPRDQRRRSAGRHARVGVGRHPAAVGFDLEEGIDGQEAVAADLFAADHALEEAGAAAGVDLVEGRDGRQRVADQPAIDRHEPGVGGKALEGIEIGQVCGGGGHGDALDVTYL